MMKKVMAGLIGVLLLGSIVWSLLHGQWEAALVTRTDQGQHRYLMSLSNQPVWDVPDAPTRKEFAAHFSNGWQEIPGQERIEIYHKWSWWYTGLMIRWLIGALIVGPLFMIFYRNDFWLGAIGRMALALIGAAAVSILLWALMGGWGPTAPEIFGFIGIAAGLGWVIAFWSRQRADCEPGAVGNEGHHGAG